MFKSIRNGVVAAGLVDARHRMARMLDRLRRTLTYANVMATLAIFGVVAGGSAYAASKIGASDVAKNAIRSKHIKKSAVKTKKIADGAVNSAKLADGSVLAQKLVDNAVTSPKIANEAVTEPKLATGAVTQPKLADGAINSAKLADGAVNNTKLANGAVNSAKLADGAVSNAKLAADAQMASINVDFDGKTLAATAGATSKASAMYGVYCIDLPFTPVAGTVSPEGAGFPIAYVRIPGTEGFGCSGFDAAIVIKDYSTPGSPTVSTARFFAIFHGARPE